jgi:hypothetical protein
MKSLHSVLRKETSAGQGLGRNYDHVAISSKAEETTRGPLASIRALRDLSNVVQLANEDMSSTATRLLHSQFPMRSLRCPEGHLVSGLLSKVIIGAYDKTIETQVAWSCGRGRILRGLAGVVRQSKLIGLQGLCYEGSETSAVNRSGFPFRLGCATGQGTVVSYQRPSQRINSLVADFSLSILFYTWPRSPQHGIVGVDLDNSAASKIVDFSAVCADSLRNVSHLASETQRVDHEETHADM